MAVIVAEYCTFKSPGLLVFAVAQSEYCVTGTLLAKVLFLKIVFLITGLAEAVPPKAVYKAIPKEVVFELFLTKLQLVTLAA